MDDLARARETNIFLCESNLTPFEEITPFTAHRNHRRFLTVILPEESLRCFDHVRIEGAGKTLVSTDQDDEIFAIASFVEQWMRDLPRNFCTQTAQHFAHLACEGTRGRDAVLRTL